MLRSCQTNVRIDWVGVRNDSCTSAQKSTHDRRTDVRQVCISCWKRKEAEYWNEKY